MALIITGFSRSGTSLLLALLYCTVRNKTVDISGEHSDGATDPTKITKNPAALAEVPNIDRPVIMLRDPRAVVTSKLQGEYFVAGDYCKNGKDLGVIGNTKLAYKYGEQSWFRYEQLVRYPDQFQARLGQYWGLEYIDEFSEWPRFPDAKMKKVAATWRRKLGKARPFDAGHGWRDHMQRIRQQFDAFPELHGCVTTLGYEQNTDWYQEVLDCTEPEPYERPKKKVHIAKPKPMKIKFKVNT